ncbi:MAG: alginate lyase family protein [Planctomycetota bacterium]
MLTGDLLYPRADEITKAIHGLETSAADEYRRDLLDRASWLKSLEPPSVVRKSSDRPRPTDDLHDYVSIGTYWWPNPDTPDGLPYVHRDGEYSPALEHYDRLSWDLHCDGISILALAHQLGDDVGRCLTDWFTAWYVDPATRMNPHLRHAQFCPGHNDGRMVGCIDFTVRLPRFLDILRRLEVTAEFLSAEVWQGIKPWWGEFLDWLISPDVRAWHEAAENNIGVFYDRSVVYLALWLGREAVAEDVLNHALARRIEPQIEAEGKLPHELRRTRSFDYSLMTVLGFVDLAVLGEARNIDLFKTSSEGSGSIESAIAWVWAQAESHEPWSATQIGPVEWHRLVRLWWCLPQRYRVEFALEKIGSRLESELLSAPEVELLSFRLHPFHQPIWESYPEYFSKLQSTRVD